MTQVIAGLIYPGAMAVDLIGPLDAFSFVNQISPAKTPPYKTVLLADRVGPIESISGVKIHADQTFEKFNGIIDTLLIPGFKTGDRSYRNSSIAHWVRQQKDSIRRIGSICSGALILAEAGLLAGRRVTTHWMDRDELEKRYPEVLVEDDKIFIRDDHIYSSGGVTAGIDLALAMIEEDHGRAMALKVAKRMVVYLMRPGGQSQFSDLLVAQSQSVRFSFILDWIEDNIDNNITVSLLADRSAMSERNFSRLFRKEVGMPPMKYVISRRLDKARRMLEETRLSIGAIAYKCGFQSEYSLRRNFGEIYQTSPRNYRDRFGLKRDRS